jgi:ABC-type uncharacterized transport system permease subunit
MKRKALKKQKKQQNNEERTMVRKIKINFNKIIRIFVFLIPIIVIASIVYYIFEGNTIARAHLLIIFSLLATSMNLLFSISYGFELKHYVKTKTAKFTYFWLGWGITAIICSLLLYILDHKG